MDRFVFSLQSWFARTRAVLRFNRETHEITRKITCKNNFLLNPCESRGRRERLLFGFFLLVIPLVQFNCDWIFFKVSRFYIFRQFLRGKFSWGKGSVREKVRSESPRVKVRNARVAGRRRIKKKLADLRSTVERNWSSPTVPVIDHYCPSCY